MHTPKGMKKRFRASGWKAGAGFLLIFIISAFGAYFIHGLLNKGSGRQVFSSTFAKFAAPEVQAQMARYERVIYPYSIIRGGARSREELAANIRTDHVVAEHYSGFDVSNAKIVKAPETRAMYVSYRMGGQVYWTANKIKIPAGEALITDGTLEARVRCGNMLSVTEMTPTSGEEPDMESFDIPQIAKLDDSEMEPFIEPGLTPLSQFPEEVVVDESPTPLANIPPGMSSGGNPPPVMAWVPSYPAGPYSPGDPGAPGGDPGTTPITPGNPGTPGGPDPLEPNVVPEPSAMVLLLTGLVGAAFIRIHIRKQ